jgi:type III secretion system FlhB-like substrate exporter
LEEDGEETIIGKEGEVEAQEVAELVERLCTSELADALPSAFTGVVE